MKIGIYINGLGQSVADENGINYATRLTNEMNKNDDDFDYNIKLEKIEYTVDEKSNLISILKKDKKTDVEDVIYKFYEFQYGETLTKCYVEKNLIYKNYLLFNIVITKFPIMIWRTISPAKEYKFTIQTLYIFLLFLIIALSILLMVPATLSLILNDSLIAAIKSVSWIYNPIHNMGIKRKDIVEISEKFVPFIALIMLIIPKANLIITGLAAEFVSAHLYLQYSQQKGIILGNLDLLYEYIVNNNTNDPEIYLHSYSFGSLIALDYLYPYKNSVKGNTLKRTKGLITIGTPFDFINTYYPKYYNDRGNEIESKIQWINVYSTTDTLASNFRNDSNSGNAEYGITKAGLFPTNINYEVIIATNFGLLNYMLLSNLKVHGMYWSETTNGKSCLDPIYMKMLELKMI